jgi:hypothetical protein
MKAEDFLPWPKGSDGRCWRCKRQNYLPEAEEKGTTFQEVGLGGPGGELTISDWDLVPIDPAVCEHKDTYVGQDMFIPTWYRWCKSCGKKLGTVASFVP